MAVKLISQAQYAEHRKCSRAAVTKAVQEGRIQLIEGKIDPVAADAQWAANTRARAGSEGAPNQEPAGGRDPASEASYMASRSRREAAEAKLAELRLGVEAGQLLRADDVRAALSRKASSLRESLMQLPSRLAPVLAASTDPAEVYRLMETELRQVLEQLTEATGV